MNGGDNSNVGDFIEVIDDALDRATCEAIVARFEASGQDQPGLVGSGHFPELKNSRDISITGRNDWQDVEQRLNQAVFGGLMRYLRKYPFALIAPLMVQRGQDASSVRRIELQDFESMDDQELANIAMAVFRPGRVNLQRYRAGEGGYPYWHCELYPKDATAETLHRHLLWTVYLNDGFQAGETEFAYQRRKIAPRTGSLLIAPTAFTHTHRGNRPEGGDKYIATSWVLFQRAEALFGAG
jgi:hypothetical protein